MSTQVARATSLVQTGTGWNNVADSFDSNTDSYSYRKSSGTSACHINGFNFNIPSNAIVSKITISTKWYTSNSYGYLWLYLRSIVSDSYIANKKLANGEKHSTASYDTWDIPASTLQSYVDSKGIHNGSIINLINGGLHFRWVGSSSSSIMSSEARVYDVYITVTYTVPWEYKVLSETNKTCYITKYNGSDTDVTVPSSIDGYTVVRLGYKFHGSLSDTTDFDSSSKIVCTEDSSITGSSYYGTFADNSTIKKVTIPSTVRWIGYQSFRNCTSLTTVSWSPSSPSVIGRTSFHNCTSLTTIDTSNIIEVYDYAFQSCTALSSLSFNRKDVQFKNYASNDSVPSNVFKNSSDGLVIRCYHRTYDNYTSTFVSKSIWYLDAIITFVSSGLVIESCYVDLGAKPEPPKVSQDGYVLAGWNDGNTIYAVNNLPVVKSALESGCIDVQYTAVWSFSKINKVYVGTAQPKVYIGSSEVAAIYVGTTKIYG